VPAVFDPQVRDQLAQSGWTILGAVGGTRLDDLRNDGAPFKSDKYFATRPADAEDPTIEWAEVAYKGELIPWSLNQPYERAQALVEVLEPSLPSGATPIIGPAVLYVHILVQHHKAHGNWLLQQCFTWATDQIGSAHVAVGAFGQRRPIVVSPIPEGYGRGIGVMPLVVPVE
jgi:hypothetical protein